MSEILQETKANSATTHATNAFEFNTQDHKADAAISLDPDDAENERSTPIIETKAIAPNPLPNSETKSALIESKKVTYSPLPYTEYQPAKIIAELVELAKKKDAKGIQSLLGEDYSINLLYEDQSVGYLLAKDHQNVEIILWLEEHFKISLYHAINSAAAHGNIALMRLLISKVVEKLGLNLAVRGAAECGDFKLMHILLKEGADIKWAIRGLAKAGFIEKMESLINNRAELMDDGAIGAAQAGRKDLVRSFIARGADIGLIVRIAAAHGHEELVITLINKNNIIEAIFGAAISGKIKFLNYLTEMAYNFGILSYLDSANFGSAMGGHLLIVNSLRQMGAKNELAIKGLITMGSLDALINFSQQIGQPHLPVFSYIEDIIQSGHLRMIAHFSRDNIYFDYLVEYAAANNYPDLLNKLLAIRSNYIIFKHALYGAAKAGHFSLLMQLPFKENIFGTMHAAVSGKQIDIILFLTERRKIYWDYGVYFSHAGVIFDEESMLTLLSNINDDDFRKELAENIKSKTNKPDIELNLKKILQTAKSINQLMQAKKLSYKQVSPDIQWLFQDKNNSLIENPRNIVAEYLGYSIVDANMVSQRIAFEVFQEPLLQDLEALRKNTGLFGGLIFTYDRLQNLINRYKKINTLDELYSALKNDLEILITPATQKNPEYDTKIAAILRKHYNECAEKIQEKQNSDQQAKKPIEIKQEQQTRFEANHSFSLETLRTDPSSSYDSAINFFPASNTTRQEKSNSTSYESQTVTSEIENEMQENSSEPNESLSLKELSLYGINSHT